jgi:hypothetical protein
MQQVEREDMMSNGSFPLPRQKAQTTCSSRGVFPVSVDGMILFLSSGRRAAAVSARPMPSPGFRGRAGLVAGSALRLQAPAFRRRFPQRILALGYRFATLSGAGGLGLRDPS